MVVLLGEATACKLPSICHGREFFHCLELSIEIGNVRKPRVSRHNGNWGGGGGKHWASMPHSDPRSVSPDAFPHVLLEVAGKRPFRQVRGLTKLGQTQRLGEARIDHREHTIDTFR